MLPPGAWRRDGGARAAAGDAMVGVRHLPLEVGRGAPRVSASDGVPRGLSLREIERRAIVQALEDCNGNRTQAARILDIDRSTLRRKMQEYAIEG